MKKPKFEIVHTDAGWHSRLRAGNGRIVWNTEVYTTRRTAAFAIDTIARMFSPTSQVWLSTVRIGSSVSTDLRYGSEGHSMWSNAHKVPVRDVDERTAGGSR